MCSLLAMPAALAAQDSIVSGRSMATRAELEALARSTSGAHQAEIQLRLTEGDFHAGDLIALHVIEDSTLTDTFTVRAGQTLKLPNVPEFSVRGLLRSELQDFMAKKIAEYIRNPQVDALPLIRVAVTGAVNRPGFFNVPAEMPASDVVMAAGGPSARASLKKVEVHRGAEVVIPKSQMVTALAAGTSLDQLNIQSGDQFVVGEQPGGLRGALQTVGLLAGVFSAIYFASRIF